MNEQVACECRVPQVLTDYSRIGTLAGGGQITESFCFRCHTWLHLVDGKPTATRLVARVPAEAEPSDDSLAARIRREIAERGPMNWSDWLASGRELFADAPQAPHGEEV